MSITDHTINAQFEYRIANLVQKLLEHVSKTQPMETGEDLETLLDTKYYKEILANLLLDDIQEWMGFDELLKQVKGE